MIKEDNCIFCKIVNGEIPSKTIYEDNEFKVILDLGPATKGHALILTKDHYSDIYELPDFLTGKVLQLAREMVVKMTKELNCDGFNIVQNNGEMAGQTVFHFHMHLIPRYKEDNQQIGWKPIEMTNTELEEVKSKLLR